LKPRAAWWELGLTAGTLIIATVVVMWVQAPTTECVMPFEASRRLVLNREVDREHLARDLASAERVARRHVAASSASAEPPISLRTCEDTLFQAIAERHGLAAGQVRASARERAAQL